MKLKKASVNPYYPWFNLPQSRDMQPFVCAATEGPVLWHSIPSQPTTD